MKPIIFNVYTIEDIEKGYFTMKDFVENLKSKGYTSLDIVRAIVPQLWYDGWSITEIKESLASLNADELIDTLLKKLMIF